MIYAALVSQTQLANPPETLRPLRRRKITPGDVESITSLLVTRRMTETEAASLLGIEPQCWFRWKNRVRNVPKIDRLLARTRAAYIHAQISNIEDGAAGRGMHKRADWRAADRLLGIVDPARFAQAPADGNAGPVRQPPQVNVWCTVAFAGQQPGQATIDCQAVKQLPQDTTKPTDK